MLQVLFEIDGFKFYSYGFLHFVAMLALALFGGWWLKRHRAEAAVAVDAAVLYPLCMFVGGNLLFNLLVLREIGITAEGFWGGYLLFLLVLAMYALLRRFPVLKTLDLFAPAIFLAVGIGKFGCFLSGCCWGIAADGFPGISLPASHHASLGTPQHPVPLYDMAVALMGTLVLIQVEKRSRTPGAVFCLFIALFGLGRFSTEFLRHEYVGKTTYLGLYVSQLVELGSVVLAVAVYLLLRKGLLPLFQAQEPERIVDRLGRDPPASPVRVRRRLAAFYVDFTPALALAIVALCLDGTARLVAFVISGLVFVAVQAVPPRSPGMALLRLELRDAQGRGASVPRRLIRALVLPVTLFSVVGMLRPLLSSTGQAFHDMLAGTRLAQKGPRSGRSEG
jgi:phosphatidylglycerol:prolipoprotein diacylglycerol transferase